MKVLKKLIPFAIVLALLAALVYFVIIPLYVTESEVTHEAPVISYFEDKADTIVLENDSLRLDFTTADTYFTVTEKATGRQWSSVPANADSDSLAIAANKETLKSTLVVQYATKSGTVDLNNYKYAIENQTYTVEKLDNAVKVTYSVGKIEKVYTIPVAITVDRFNAFMEAMGSKNAKKTKDNYTLYSMEKLEGKDNKDEIIAMYPEIENQPLYILKSDVKESNKKKLEGYFAEGGYNEEEYETDMQLVAGSSTKAGAVFNVSVIYRLEGNDLVVEIPYSELRYMDGYPITNITVLPMFGAAGKDEDGFMFIPEGGGAIINNNNGKLSQNSYYANMYGWDYGSDRTEAVSETRCDYPVFGMSKNGGSFICIMEGAPAYGGIQADISGRYNSYNWICAKYKVLHYDQYNVSAKTAQLVYMFEKEIPDDSIVQRYRFIDSDSYVDMAKAYGDYLTEKNPQLAAGNASEEVPVMVELVGAIDKTVVTAGLPIDRVLSVTSFEQAATIISEIQNAGAANLNVRMTGWSNGGVNQQVLTSVKAVSSMGGEKGMKNLIAAAKSSGVSLYFDGISCFAYDSGIFDGFSAFSDAARLTTREQIYSYGFDPITYQPRDWEEDYKFYLVKPSYASKMASNLISALGKTGAQGVAFRDIGKLLSADYNPKDCVTRQQVLNMNIAALKEAQDANLDVMIKQGNDYAVPYADIVTDMDYTGHRYSIIDETVPFYQIALHGKIDYTGVSVNTSNDFTESVLKSAEYGGGLSFTFMAENTTVLQDTLYSGYYAAWYESWKDDAAKVISRYQSDMAGLNSLSIENHARVGDSAYVTEYSDGTKVYVNYSDKDFSQDGIDIPARDYVVVRGDK